MSVYTLSYFTFSNVFICKQHFSVVAVGVEQYFNNLYTVAGVVVIS